MEIYVTNIAYAASEHDVTRCIAHKLHVRPFTVSLPLNFHLHLFRDKRQKNKHGGNGSLTIPDERLGQLFLEMYGQGRQAIQVMRRPLKLQISRKNPPSADLLVTIRNTPYLDPQIREERERRDRQLAAEHVSIRTLQFGWECRDTTFSIEWERTLREAQLLFNAEKRRIEIRLPGVLNSTHGFIQETILIDFSQIAEIFTSHSDSTHIATRSIIYLSLTNPPTYIFRQGNLSEGDKIPPSKRSHCLLIHGDDMRPHEDVAPYLYNLRLVCNSADDVDRFDNLATTAGLNMFIDDSFYPAEKRGLFSALIQQRFREWISQIHFSIAFALQRLLLQGYVDPLEMLALRDDVDKIIRDGRRKQDKNYAVDILRDFGAEAYSIIENPNSKNPKTLRSCLLEKARLYEKMKLKSLNRIDDDDLFMCLHVEITPSSIRFEGPLPERTNRVIRSYPDEFRRNFIRVSFVDEGRLKIQHDRDIDGEDFVKKRFGPYLHRGLEVAGRTFRFLAYSQSALKEHTVWFMRSFRLNDGQGTREGHG